MTLRCYNILFTTKQGMRIRCEDVYLYQISLKYGIKCSECGIKYDGKQD